MSLFAMFKGESGAGKTVGASSFPNPVVLDFDKKGSAIAQKHFPGKEIKYLQFRDIMEAGQLIEDWSKIGCPFETVIVDSITSLSYMCLKTIDDIKGKNILTKLRDIKDSKKGVKTVETRGYDYYNAEDNFLKFFIDGLKTIWTNPGNPKNVIIIAHVMTSEGTDAETKEIIKTRRIVTAGKAIAAYIPAQFDEVWHFGIERGALFDDNAPKIKHYTITESLGDDYAKTAYNLETKIDFTRGSLYDIIKSDLETTSNATQKEIISTPAKKTLNF